MSCMTLFAPMFTMATTQLAHTACQASSEPWLVEGTAARKQSLSMSWVVVTGENGKRQLRMRWKKTE